MGAHAIGSASKQASPTTAMQGAGNWLIRQNRVPVALGTRLRVRDRFTARRSLAGRNVIAPA